MGHEVDQAALEAYSSENFKLRLVENQMRGTLETLFSDGGAISGDAKMLLGTVNPEVLPPESRELYAQGRISEVFSTQVGIPTPYGENHRKLFVIPPNTARNLAYSHGKYGGLKITVVYGLKDGTDTLEEYDLFKNTRLIIALANLARERLTAHGLSARKAKPKRMVNEILHGMAANHGYTTHENALELLKAQRLEVKTILKAAEEIALGGNIQ